MQVVGVQRRSDTTTCPRQCRSVTRPDRHRSGRAGSSATRPRDDWTGISAISAGKPPPMSTFSRSWRVVRGDHREQHVRPGQAQHQPFGFLRRAQVGRRPSQHREPERHLALVLVAVRPAQPGHLCSPGAAPSAGAMKSPISRHMPFPVWWPRCSGFPVPARRDRAPDPATWNPLLSCCAHCRVHGVKSRIRAGIPGRASIRWGRRWSRRTKSPPMT